MTVYETSNQQIGNWLAAGGCASLPQNRMPTVANVDLERFMGDWYVIASIPTPAEREAKNPLENYRLNDAGTVATTFTFNRKRVDGPTKTLRMTGFVNDAPENGVWRMQLIWPFKADYRL